MSLPLWLVIGVSDMRPALGMRPASVWSSHSRAPGPLKTNFAKPVVSIRPTPLRTASAALRT